MICQFCTYPLMHCQCTMLRQIQVDPIIQAAKRMRDAYLTTRRMESGRKTCPTIDEFDKLLAEYER